MPDGCKNLTDVPKPAPKSKPAPVPLQQPLPPIIGEIAVPEWMTARQLADVLKQKPFKIMADLMEIKVMVTLNMPIPIDVIAKVARKYGFTVRKDS